MNILRLALVAMLLIALPSENAMACTVQGSEIAAKARKKRLAGAIKIEGQFRVERTEPEGNDPNDLRKMLGVITSKSGKEYRTIHDQDGRAILLCATFYTPSQDVEGVFYLEGLKDNSFRLMHWEDKYLTEPTESETEGL